MKIFTYFKTLALVTVILTGTAPVARGMDDKQSDDQAKRTAKNTELKAAILKARERRAQQVAQTTTPAAQPAQTDQKAAKQEQNKQKANDKENDPDALDLVLIQEIEALNIELGKRALALTNSKSFAETGRVMAEITRYIQAHPTVNTLLTIENHQNLKKNQQFLSAIEALKKIINNIGMAILQNKNNRNSPITREAHQQIATTIRLFETISGRQRLVGYFEQQFPNPEQAGAQASSNSSEKSEKKEAAKPTEQPKKADKKADKPKAKPKKEAKPKARKEDAQEMPDQQIVNLQTLNTILTDRIEELKKAKSPEKIAEIIQKIEAEFKQFITGKIDADTAKRQEFAKELARLNANVNAIIKIFTDNKNYKIMRDKDSHLEAETAIRLSLHRIGNLINRKELSVTETEMDTSHDREQAQRLAEEEKKEAAKRQAKLAENDAKLARQLAQQNSQQANRFFGLFDSPLVAAVRSQNIDEILAQAAQADTKDIEQAIDVALQHEETRAIAEMLTGIIESRNANVPEDKEASDAKQSRKRGREAKKPTVIDISHDGDDQAGDEAEDNDVPAKKKQKTGAKKKKEHPLLEAVRTGTIDTILEIATDTDDETLAQACTLALENQKEEIAAILLGITESRQEAQESKKPKASKKRKREAADDSGETKLVAKPKAKAKPGKEAPKKKQKTGAATDENTRTITCGSYAECKEEEAKILKRAKPVDVDASRSSKDGDSYNGLFRLNKQDSNGNVYVRIVLKSEEESEEEESEESEEESEEEESEESEEEDDEEAAQERAKKAKKKSQDKKPAEQSRCIIM